MSDPYGRLAEILDTIPNSFTPMSDGTHLKILQWIFTPQEADLASKMKLRGETIEELGERLGMGIERLEPLLETMAKKGQIRAWNSSTGRRYALMPFVVGIYEEQLCRMNREFAELAETFFVKGQGGELFSTPPAIHMVIPINQMINSELVVHHYEQAEQIIENASSWGVRECICRKHQELLDNRCKYPISVCLVFARKPNAFDDSELTKPITKEESLRLLNEAEDAGLVHCTMNIQSGHFYICNCCTCCCNVLRAVVMTDKPHVVVRSNYIAVVDEELCSGCGICVDRCQFSALTIEDGISAVNQDRCVGCGVCGVKCPEDAIRLHDRDEKIEPPESIIAWMTEKAMARGKDPSELL